MYVLGSPVCVVCGCGQRNRLVAAAVRVRAPVRDQLKLRQLERREGRAERNREGWEERSTEENISGKIDKCNEMKPDAMSQ